MTRLFTNLSLALSPALFLALGGALACGGGSKEADTTPAATTNETPPGGEAGGGAAPGGEGGMGEGKPTEAPKMTAADQLAKGEKVYADSCASCHGEKGEGRGKKNPAVIGAKALKKAKTAADVYSYAKAKMPKDDPGSLQDDDYLAVTAYLVSKNGKTIGEQPLTAESAAAIQIH
jgi:mono/diheme cytochrome c family protein